MINHIGDANEKVLSIIDRLRAYARNQTGWHNIDDVCDEAADEIIRLRAEVAARWLPIESAPKDGTEILGGELYRYLPYKPDGRRQMRADGRWQRWNGTRYENCEAPSHFQPLFAPPQPESAT